MTTPFEAAKAAHDGKAPTISFGGEKFHVVDPGAMAMVSWAAASDLDTDSPSPEEVRAANAAIFHMLEAVIADEDFKRFESVARKRRATGDELLKVIGDAMAAVTGRPTGPSSASDDEPETSGRSSTVASGGTAARRRSA